MENTLRRKKSGSVDDEEYSLQRKLRKIQKQLAELDKRGKHTPPAPPSGRQRSLSPFAPVALTLTRTDASPSRACSTERTCDDNDSVFMVYNGVRPELQDERVESEVEDNAVPIASELNQTVLSILGLDTSQGIKEVPLFQKDIALSWTDILRKSLSDEERSTILDKYAPPENCPLLEAPKLNLEVASAIREVVARRDKKISDLQNQVGNALSALGQLLTSLLKKSNMDNNLTIIQLASDASRLLLDFHYKQSISRRELISLDLKKEAKQTLSDSHVDGWLFGDKLGERLKASKEVERSGLDLRPIKPKVIKKSVTPLTNYNSNRNLNLRGPPRQQRDYQGGRRQSLQNPKYSGRQVYQQMEKRRGSHLRSNKREQARPRNPRENLH